MSGCSRRPAVAVIARCLPVRVRVPMCALAWLLLLPVVARAESAPFVAGFDRFFRDAAAADLAVGGRLLLAELNCTACHRTSDRTLEPKQGPHLNGAGEQLRPQWIRQFLSDPHAAKPGTTMPDLLAGLSDAGKTAAIDALTAFLSTQFAGFPELNSTAANPIAPEFWDKGDAERGRELYHHVGCVACHEPDQSFETGRPELSEQNQRLLQLDPEDLRELGLLDRVMPVRSVPHPDLRAKYTRKSLAHFLIDPARTRPGGRMPGLKLRPDEAADITAYLLQGQKDEAWDAATNVELIARGRKLFSEVGCVNCHQVQGLEPGKLAARFKSLSELDPRKRPGCLSGGTPELPRFGLSELQRQAIGKALAELQQGSGRESSSPQSQVEFSMLQLNCYGCHERNGRGGVGPNRWRYFETAGHVDIGDEGSIPPPLDFVGYKLKPAWLKKVLEGTGDVRPHMLARMPRFPPASVADLPGAFAAADSRAKTPPAETATLGNFPKPTDELTEAGRELFNFGCVQCHPVRGEQLPGVVGVDVANVARRIEPAWFHEFLLNPMTLKPRTRMPTFFPNGKSSNQELFGGDVDRQIAAMWVYLNDVDRRELPQKLIEGKAFDFTLIPNERPVLLRTFMKSAGTHAIAVGFPEGVHLAFDAEQVRVAQFWRGAFLDAHGTWFDRFAPPAEPLGDDVVLLPASVPLAVLKHDSDDWPSDAERAGYRFRGYRLDRQGVPTFLYRVGALDVEDRFEPAGKGMRRTLQLTIHGRDLTKPVPVWFLAHAGANLAREGDVLRDASGLGVTVAGHAAPAQPRQSADRSEWRIPLKVQKTARVEVQYQW